MAPDHCVSADYSVSPYYRSTKNSRLGTDPHVTANINWRHRKAACFSALRATPIVVLIAYGHILGNLTFRTYVNSIQCNNGAAATYENTSANRYLATLRHDFTTG